MRCGAPLRSEAAGDPREAERGAAGRVRNSECRGGSGLKNGDGTLEFGSAEFACGEPSGGGAGSVIRDRPRGAEPSGSGARRCGRAQLGVAIAGRGAVGGPLCSVLRAVGVAVPGSEDCEGSRSSVLRTAGVPCVLGTGGCVDPGARHGARLHGGAHSGRARAVVPREFLTVLQISLGFLFLESQPGAPRPPS